MRTPPLSNLLINISNLFKSIAFLEKELESLGLHLIRLKSRNTSRSLASEFCSQQQLPWQSFKNFSHTSLKKCECETAKKILFFSCRGLLNPTFKRSLDFLPKSIQDFLFPESCEIKSPQLICAKKLSVFFDISLNKSNQVFASEFDFIRIELQKLCSSCLKGT